MPRQAPSLRLGHVGRWQQTSRRRHWRCSAGSTAWLLVGVALSAAIAGYGRAGLTLWSANHNRQRREMTPTEHSGVVSRAVLSGSPVPGAGSSHAMPGPPTVQHEQEQQPPASARAEQSAVAETTAADVAVTALPRPAAPAPAAAAAEAVPAASSRQTVRPASRAPARVAAVAAAAGTPPTPTMLASAAATTNAKAAPSDDALLPPPTGPSQPASVRHVRSARGAANVTVAPKPLNTWQPVFFVHVMKTGGTTLWAHLESAPRLAALVHLSTPL